MNKVIKLYNFRFIFFSFFLLLFLLLPFVSYSQTLKGEIKGFDNEKLIGASIVLYLADTTSIVGFSISGEKGKWKIENQIKKGMLLAGSYLGYKTKYLMIDSSIMHKDTILIVLGENVIKLKEVKIEAKPLYIVVKGDTISYNVNLFRNERTITLGDLIRNMPNIEIIDNGDILYNGKRIDKLLLEGKDILSDQHKLTTEGLQADDIRSIQIINHYRPFDKQYLPDKSKKVAMDIRLTDEAIKQINGDIDIMGGYKNSYQAKTNLYRVNEKSGLTTFIRANNIGKSNITAGDFLSLKGNLYESLKETKGDFSKLIPEGFLPSIDVRENYDNVFLANLEIKKSKLNTTKFTTMLNFSQRLRESYIQKSYNGDSISQNGTQTGKTSLPYMFCKFGWNKMLPNKNGYLSLKIPMYVDISTNNQDYKGEIALQNSINLFAKKNKNFTVSPELNYHKKISLNQSFFLKSNIFFENTLKELSLEQKGNINAITNQNSNSKKSELGIKTGYIKTKNNLEMIVESGTRLISVNKSINSTETPMYNKDIRHSLWNLNTKINIQYKKNVWFGVFNFESDYNSHHIDTISKNNLLFNSDLTIKYSYNPLHFLLLGFSYSKAEPHHNLWYNTYEYIDENTVKYESLPLENLIKQYNANLSYLYFNMENDFRFYSIANFTKSQGAVYPEFKIENGLFIQFFSQSESQNSISFRNEISSRWAEKKITFKLNTGWNTSHTVISNGLVIKLQQYMQKFTIKYIPTTSIELEYSYQLNYQTRIFSGVSKSVDQKHEIKVFYAINNIRMEGKIQHRKFAGSIISNKYITIDAILEYRFKNNLTLKISGNDLTHLSPDKIYSYHQTIGYFEVLSYYKFPGTILLGIKKLF